MQPFLGFNDLTTDVTVQANQHCLALAAAHLPQEPCLVSHGSVVMAQLIAIQLQ